MATDGSDEWHRIGDAVSPETTVRHSEPHRVELSSWARQHELSGIFDAVALTFGFTENFTIIGNLSRELSQPEADSLLTQWADNPYIAQLTRLRDAYFQSPEISFLYAGITHAGTADQTRAMLRRSGAVIAKQHFLLTMIINPLAQAPTATIYGLRRMLRIWLLVQALMRTVEQGCCRDQQIQVMASALTLDTLAPKWEEIDRILEHALRILGAPVFSYGQFTLALQRAARAAQTGLFGLIRSPNPAASPGAGHGRSGPLQSDSGASGGTRCRNAGFHWDTARWRMPGGCPGVRASRLLPWCLLPLAGIPRRRMRKIRRNACGSMLRMSPRPAAAPERTQCTAANRRIGALSALVLGQGAASGADGTGALDRTDADHLQPCRSAGCRRDLAGHDLRPVAALCSGICHYRYSPGRVESEYRFYYRPPAAAPAPQLLATRCHTRELC